MVGILSLLRVDVGRAQDDEGGEAAFTVNGVMKVQGGVFAPLASSGFEAEKNRAYISNSLGQRVSSCSPITSPALPCVPVDHGQKPGSPSIARGMLQIEAHWKIAEQMALHAIVRGVRSLSLPADRYAQVPTTLENPDDRASYAQNWARDHYYNQFDLREFYLDLWPTDWLSFRLGRQQVAWGDTGQYRLLDVVNPTDNSWHFGPLESLEDTRIPNWMALTAIDVPKLDSTLELLWIPMIDRPRDTVTVPLTLVGAWGLPYTNTPTSFTADYKNFRYPGGRVQDMRGGVRWKGPIGQRATYSLVYMYTHQMSPPVLSYFQQRQVAPDVYDPNRLDEVVLRFPRQHIAGFSADYAFDNPVGVVARIEAAVEPNRTYSVHTDANSFTGGLVGDSSHPGRFNYGSSKETAVNYALVLTRPTMIRLLNPTQNFLLVAQFMHSFVPTLSKKDVATLVEVPGYNNWGAQAHSYRVIFYAQTSYLHGLITPKLTAVYIPTPYAHDSAFYSIDVGLRLTTRYSMNLTVTDFFGGNAYRDLGMYRDRDEVAASFSAQF